MKYADVAILTSLSALGQQGRNVRWPSPPIGLSINRRVAAVVAGQIDRQTNS